MKNLLFFILSFLVSSLSSGQKLEKFKLEKIYYVIPSNQNTLETLKTYNVSINCGGEALACSDIRDRLKIERFENVKQDGDFEINCTTSEHFYNKTSLKSSGAESSLKYYYYAKFSAKMKVSVILANGTLLFEKVYLVSKSHNGKKHSTTAEAKRLFESRKITFEKNFFSDEAEKIVKELASEFTDVNTKRSAKLLRIKAKKFDYENAYKAEELFLEAHSIHSFEEQLNPEMKNKLVEAIDLWNKELEDADPENKKARINHILTPAIHYNLGLAHFLIQDYQLAEKHFRISKEIRNGITQDQEKWWMVAQLLNERTQNN